ncbi:hypothetical protein [Nocardioides ungokensis]|uniref:hypothetical protein n=1 Tax=Nocardioides ungokensis TaxID=1643322 RepID=UPI0015DDD791|nr:hypothetical protein [Nocardioides ungokensis]
MASGELGPLPKHLAGLPVADAELQARDLGWVVRVKRPGEIYPAGPFRADRANLHVDGRDVVIDVSVG